VTAKAYIALRTDIGMPDTVRSNVRGHRADEMNETIRYAASEAPRGPRC